MKRFLALITVLTVAVGMCSMAWAVEIKVKGQWKFGMGWYGNRNFYNTKHDGQQEDAFRARQRVRTQFDFIVSENLKGTVQLEIGTLYWGYTGSGSSGRSSGGQLDADGVNVETKHAFLDWMVPGTDMAVRMGIQRLILPSATGFGSPVFSADVAGITANYKFNDTVSATAFWVRPFDYGFSDADNKRLCDELDMFGLILPIKLDNMKFTPWGAYASIGGASGYWAYRAGNQSDLSYTATTAANRFDGRSNAWWGGLATELNMFDPLSIRFDVMYGRLSGSSDGNVAANLYSDLGGNPKSSGWFMDAIIDYKTDWGTPGLIGWYSSGDDYEDTKNGEFGRIPIVGADVGFGPTYMGTCNPDGWPYDKALTRSGVGMWGIGARIKDLTFIDNLTHLVTFAYVRGTNDKDIVSKNNMTNPRRGGRGEIQSVFGEYVYMTTGDAAYEINLSSWYKLYEGFTAQLNLGWIHLDLDDVWKKDANGHYGTNTSNAWTAEVIFNWAF